MTSPRRRRTAAITIPTMAPVGRLRLPRAEEELGTGSVLFSPWPLLPTGLDGVALLEVEESVSSVLRRGGTVTEVAGCAEGVEARDEGSVEVETSVVCLEEEAMRLEAVGWGDGAGRMISVIVTGAVKINDSEPSPVFTSSP